MRVINRIAIISFFVILIITSPYKIFAQPIDPCTDPIDPCPIDSNLIVLVISALVVAAKKSYDFKQTALL